jgi:hypothetical protein
MADMSPVSLSYAAALRGVKPRVPGKDFRYAHLACRDFLSLVCLAASNPEGRFVGVAADAEAAAKAREVATARCVLNVAFTFGTPSSLVAEPAAMPSLLSSLDYLVIDETFAPLSVSERQALFSFAEKNLKPSGLFAYSYRAYDNPDEILRFLVNELAPATTATQARELLDELKALGPLYFKDHPITLAALDRAIDSGVPDDFFATCRRDEAARSGTFDTLAGLLPWGFAFAGAADIDANYMELSTPPSAHDVLSNCREHLLYEAVKDFAMNRLVRHDIWCRLPAVSTDSSVELFGDFTYGITLSREQVPSRVTTSGKVVDLSLPLFANMIEVMTALPMGLGDFLQHPLGKDADATEALEALQVLIALCIARPMRGLHQSTGPVQLTDLKWATAYNRYLNDTPINERQVLLASQVIGNGVSVPARDALVMQAINRAGIENSPLSLFAELKRIARDPALAAMIMDTEPSQDMVDNMIHDVVTHSMVQWYAYGLLAA